MEFEWDESKNRANFRKHGIAFEDAIEVFDDPENITVGTRTVGAEIRVMTAGFVAPATLLVVHTDRTSGDGLVRLRIISARRASRTERNVYERR